MHDTVSPQYWEAELIYKPISYRVIKADEDELIGYLTNGKFVSLEKANHIPLFPRPVAIYKSHLGNYSQVCSLSKLLVVDNLRSHITGEPICLFQY